MLEVCQLLEAVQGACAWADVVKTGVLILRSAHTYLAAVATAATALIVLLIMLELYRDSLSGK